jgi:hypothetical protein
MSGGSQEARDADALGGTCVLTEALDGPGSSFGTEMVYLPKGRLELDQLDNNVRTR